VFSQFSFLEGREGVEKRSDDLLIDGNHDELDDDEENADVFLDRRSVGAKTNRVEKGGRKTDKPKSILLPTQ